jgi:aspartyl/glutamyl-tRNA(Asn/Gln) amidotransferase C subunit
MNIDVQALSLLARIAITPDEAQSLERELSSVLDFVKDIASAHADLSPDAGEHHSVLRTDVVMNAPGEYTERFLANAPRKEGAYIAVPIVIEK